MVRGAREEPVQLYEGEGSLAVAVLRSLAWTSRSDLSTFTARLPRIFRKQNSDVVCILQSKLLNQTSDIIIFHWMFK